MKKYGTVLQIQIRDVENQTSNVLWAQKHVETEKFQGKDIII